MAPEPGQSELCRFFKLGLCKKGAACEFAHISEPDPQPNAAPVPYRKPCFDFAKGRCKRGLFCPYSHDHDAVSSLQHNQAFSDYQGRNGHTNQAGEFRPVKDETDTQARLRTWRRDLPFEVQGSLALSSLRLTTFFQEARKLAAIESAMAQEVVTALASDGGLKRIGELVGRPFDTISDILLAKIFRTQVIPFFSMLASENVDRSALLEGRVANLYAFIFSPNGQRAIALFKAVQRFLGIIITEDTMSVDSVASDSCLFVMAKTMEINGSAHITEPFIPIIEEISALFDTAQAAQQPFSRVACKNLRKIQQRLNLGKHIPTMIEVKEILGKPVFETVRDLPGNLSDQGPRHDNDHVSIQDIKIMPTLSEITAPRNEYLPSFDPKDWHVEGVEGLLDRQFRLVREDTVGQLRDAAKYELDKLQNPVLTVARKDAKLHGARTFTYHNLHFEESGWDEFKGLEFAVSFDQPFDFSTTPEQKRSRVWEDSKRLGMDALVCLIDAAGSAAFLIVSHPFVGQTRIGRSASHRLHEKFDRHSDHRRASVVLRFVEYDRDIAKQAMSFFDSNNAASPMELVEFPGVLVPAFLPTLTALKNMSGRLDLPFADLLLQTNTRDNVSVGPPEYALSDQFSYDLAAISTLGMRLSLDADGNTTNFDIEAFKASTSLDSGQADALISSLSRSFAITQGPPGTGKSYTGIALIKVLLDNKDAAHLGPLLLVSYTNHALDQMLEHLVDAGVKQIIRIGSRSKSERLTELNLRRVSMQTAPTKTERSERYRLKNEIKTEGHAINNILLQLSNLGHQKSIEQYLMHSNTEHFEQLFGRVDSEGFQLVDHHPETRFARWLRGELYTPRNHPARSMDSLSMCNLQNTSLQERFMLHRQWTVEMKHDLGNGLAQSLETYHNLKARLDLIRTEHELRTLSGANVIGVTTSGLARNLTLLRKLSSKVLISEEAGEVQEAHLLTALLPSIEHVILIGDHLQLRPQVQNFALSSESSEGKQYCLDVSLFERLVKPLATMSQPLPFSTLDVQRRMYPSIAKLIRSTLYPSLKDAPSVERYPEVMGMRHRLFWLDHNNGEDNTEISLQSTSKTNEWEADMTVALVRHLVRQGVYKPSDIAVLTPYLGQLRKLRDKLRGFYEITISEGDAVDLGEISAPIEDGDAEDSSTEEEEQDTETALQRMVVKRTLMESVRLSTIDNFQGEEATVVVISLVRCNDNRNPGFLRTENRCNVLLSRAKHGMYIIGSAATASAAPMWAKVIEQLKPDLLGDTLELACGRHPEKSIKAGDPEKLYQLAPAGGCEQLCGRQLDCGHACPEFCHADIMHRDVHCLKDCAKVLPCEHPCPNPCGDKCVERCRVVIQDFEQTLECGHVLKNPPCHQVHNLEKYVCKEPVEKTVPGCGHSVLVPCSINVQDKTYACSATCGASLPCGHRCDRDCKTCNKKSLLGTAAAHHGGCKSVCGRDYSNCRHSCTKTCHSESGEPCRPCQEPCEARCKHARCSKICSEPCVPCSEEVCPSQCPHTEPCQYPCGAPCDWVPCNRRCTKRIACGCVCPSLCGEPCPDERFCHLHGEDSVLSQPVDYIEFKEYRDVDIDADPVLVLECGHIFTIESLDGHMEMAAHYDMDQDGALIAVRESSSRKFSKDEMKSCPVCRASLRNISRYGRIVRRAHLDEATRKFICWSNGRYIKMANRMMTEQDRLSATAADAKLTNRSLRLVGDRDNQVTAIRENEQKRYTGLFSFRRLLLHFQHQVQAAEQPFQRVRDMVEAVRRRKAGEGVTIPPFDFDQSLLQTRASLLSAALLLNCDLTILSDVLSVRDKTASIPGKRDQIEVDFSVNRLDCEKLIAQAQKSSQKVQEVEGHVYWARFAALENNVAPAHHGVATEDQQSPAERLREEALVHLDLAASICGYYPSQTSSVSHEIEPTRKMLRDSVFYTPVSSDEMRAVVGAMANEFTDTGHWYRCINGHLFTIGECGRPMQTSRCPQCGETVGGLEHQNAEGVTSADDVEEEFGGLRV